MENMRHKNDKAMDKKDEIELRSEKMRHVIGTIPPRLVRLGTVVIVAVCVMLGLCLWLVDIDGKRLFSLIFRR